MNVLVWYRRDLRVEDHPALAHAAGLGAVLPVYIAEPEYWAGPDTSARQWAFVAETLAGLRRDLAGLGAPLVVRVGGAVEVLARLCKQNRITRIFSHADVGGAWSVARDAQMAAWARDAGIEWTVLAPVENVAKPAGLRMVAGIEPGVIPTARALRMQADACVHSQTGGRGHGLALMDSFLGQRGRNYVQAMAAPLSAERACSRLSPYLAVGAVSAPEVERAVLAQLELAPNLAPDLAPDAAPDAGRVANLRAFQTRMVWRGQSMGTAVPQMDRQPFSAEAAALPARAASGPVLEAWAAGQTGLPYLDACMRYLAATGWINFQAREMLALVASYHLWLDWRVVGQVLARRFVDYEPALLWPQVQKQAGVAGLHRMRVYDPVKQGLAMDVDGTFTRRWVPELAQVPDAFLHCPWKWPEAQGILGRRYPEPVVDLGQAARAARAAFAPLRGKGAALDDDVVLLEESAGALPNPAYFMPRKTGQRRQRTVAQGQLCMDL